MRTEQASDPTFERWVVGESQEDEPLIYVKRTLSDGEVYAHTLFVADWGEMETAEHIVKLHNDWLDEREAAGL